MPRDSPSRRVLVVGLVGVLLLAGCSTLPTGGLSDADAVGEHVQQRYDRIDSYTATVTKTVETPTSSASVRARLDVETDERMRLTYESGARAGTTETVDLSASDAARPVLSTGLQRAGDGQRASYGALAETLVRTSNVTLERTTVLDGHRTAVVSLDRASDANASTSVERRVWIDTERRLPLKVETTWTGADGATTTETVRYANVTVHEHDATSGGTGEATA